MTLIRWEPFRDLDDIFTRHNPFFGRLAVARQGTLDEGETPSWTPLANISETDTDYLIKAELPEVSKEDVKVTVDENVITISGERRKEAEHKDEKVHRVESYYGQFSRSFRLPEDADIKAIHAESRNGVLKVRVPKMPAPKPQTVEVQVN
jgi:HSP20 family protein